MLSNCNNFRAGERQNGEKHDIMPRTSGWRLVVNGTAEKAGKGNNEDEMSELSD
jgi:hypothetical protein